MYTENNFRTPRGRINEALARRVIEESSNRSRYSEPCISEQKPPCNYSPSSKGPEKLVGYPLASVYAPVQCWKDIYDIEYGFERGTIFKELDLPFVCGDRKGGNGCVLR